MGFELAKIYINIMIAKINNEDKIIIFEYEYNENNKDDKDIVKDMKIMRSLKRMGYVVKRTHNVIEHYRNPRKRSRFVRMDESLMGTTDYRSLVVEL